MCYIIHVVINFVERLRSWSLEVEMSSIEELYLMYIFRCFGVFFNILVFPLCYVRWENMSKLPLHNKNEVRKLSVCFNYMRAQYVLATIKMLLFVCK